MNEDAEHPSAEVGETTYHVRWYDYEPSEDTYEPIKNLPRNQVVSYYKRKKLTLTDNIEKAQLG